MSNMKRETGVHIIQDVYKEDPLHPCVCPNCGNCSLDSNGKPIISYDSNSYSVDRTPKDIFTVKRYEWVPQRCTACNTRFIGYVSTERTNEDMVFAVLVLLFGIITTIVAVALSIIFSVVWLWCLIVTIGLILGGLTGISESFYSKDTGIEGVESMVNFPEEDEEETRSVESLAVNLLKKEKEPLQPDFPVVESISQARKRKKKQEMTEGNDDFMVVYE